MALSLVRLTGLHVSRKCLSRRCLSQAQNPRPPTAPKQFPDIKSICQNVYLFERNCQKRNYEDCAEHPGEIAGLLYEADLLSQQASHLSQKIKEAERKIADSKAPTKQPSPSGDEVVTTVDDARASRDELNRILHEKTSLEANARALALSLPNLTHPKSLFEKKPSLITYINHDPQRKLPTEKTKSHVDVGTALSILDFKAAGTSTGWGFYYLINEAALLEHALVQYATSIALGHGWKAVSPPSLVYSHIADACGFRPRDQNDEQQIWTIEQAEKDSARPKRSLAATAEIPLAAMYAGRDIPEDQLPLKFVGSSRCYRSEAGARGVSTKGLYRVHEFTKVEMFAWTNSEEGRVDSKASDQVFDEMLSIQMEILSALGLPCRVLEMPAPDLGASAYRKVDIEAWFPSRTRRDGGWGEVTSLSMCIDYQSRRLGTRILEKSGKRSYFPHTINGTAMAIPRVLAAILEHGWREESSCVTIPEILRPYMGGQEAIWPK